MQDAALLGSLDGVGAHALEVDALGDGPAGHDGLQARGAELGRLLDHVVEAGTLERREQVVDVGAGFLRARLLGRA